MRIGSHIARGQVRIGFVHPLHLIGWNKRSSQDMNGQWNKPIRHFRVPLCLCFKTCFHAKPHLRKYVLSAWKWTCRRNLFSWITMVTLALRLVLIQRQKATQKWPITVQPRFNEVAGYRPNLFVKWRVRYVKCQNSTVSTCLFHRRSTIHLSLGGTYSQ